jgi:transposase
MPEQNLTNLLNLPNLEVLRYEATDNEAVILEVKPTLKVAVCPDCKKPSATLHDYDESRLIRDLSLFGRKCYLRLRSRRFECEACGCSFTERLEWIAFDSSYTRRFEEYVFTLCRKNTIQDVSQLLELGYEAVDGLFKRQAKKRHRHGKKGLSA